MLHPSQTQLLEFAAGQATEKEAERIYQHLAECPPCTARYRVIQETRKDPAGSWNAFISEFRARAEAHAAPAAQTTEPAARAERRFDLLIRTIIDGPRGLATAAAACFAEARQAGQVISAVWVPGFAGVGDKKTSEDADRLAEKAAEQCARGEYDLALATLNATAQVDPLAAGTARLDLVYQDQVVGQVIVQAERRTISVLAQPELLGAGNCYMILKPTDPQAPERRVKLQPVSGAPYLLAEIEDIDAGRFSIGLVLLHH